MANLRTGPLITDLRGSVGDVTFSRNQGGIYAKRRTVMPPSNTVWQQYARSAMEVLSQAWSAYLTDTARQSWRAYAHAWPQRDTWGTPTATNGYTRFVQVNFQFMRLAAQNNYPDPPEYSDVLTVLPPPSGPLSPPQVQASATAGPDSVTVTLPPANYDPAPAGLILYAYQSPGCSAGKSYPSSFRRAASVNSNVPPWDLDPWTWTSPYDLEEGQKLWVRVIAQALGSGEVSTPYTAAAFVEASP